MSISSAVNDSRFEPMELEELGDLELDISVLHTFESMSEPFDWDLDKHGITLEI